MLLDLAPQLLNLLLVVVKTVAQVLLHVAHFSLLREQVEQVLNLEHIILPDDRQGFLDLHLLPGLIIGLRSEQVLGYLHPELLAGLAAGWLVGVVTSHVGVIDLERLLDSLGVEIQDAVQNDLCLLYVVYSFFEVLPLLRVHWLVFVSL